MCTSWIFLSMVGRNIDRSKKKVLTRSNEHQQDTIKGNWDALGATDHTKEYHGQIKWINLRTITVVLNMNKRKVRETLR